MFIHICEHRIKHTIHKQAKKGSIPKKRQKTEENI